MTININFTDFWPGFNKTDNFFYNLLVQDFDVNISDNPDYIFFSIFGNRHQSYNCTKIAFFAENLEAPLGYCKWAFSNDYLDDSRQYRLPLYLWYDGYYSLTDKIIDDSLSKRKFCNFVVSNGSCAYRNQFFNRLSEYKKVDSGGQYLNNIGYYIENKRQFQSEYKFSIAFENDAYRGPRDGYTTEKIMEPMTVNSMPIYWGNPVIDREFNRHSFINFYDFDNIDRMIDYVIELDNNDDMYIEKLKQHWFVDNTIPEKNQTINIKKFLNNIFI